jgi:hypothetical protein
VAYFLVPEPLPPLLVILPSGLLGGGGGGGLGLGLFGVGIYKINK